MPPNQAYCKIVAYIINVSKYHLAALALILPSLTFTHQEACLFVYLGLSIHF